MGFTTYDYYAMRERLAKNCASKSRELPHCDEFEKHTGLERDLHDKIKTELQRRRWYYIHSRTDKPTTTALGVTDFIVATGPRNTSKGYRSPTTYYIEVKRKGSKLTKEQTITKHVLQALGHPWACVYSFDEFFAFIAEN